MACLNRNTPQFQDLLYRTGLNADILAAIVGNYQRVHGEDMFPTADNINALRYSDPAFNPYTGNLGTFQQSISSTPTSYNFDVNDALTDFDNYSISFTRTSNTKDVRQHKGVDSLIMLKQRNRDMAANKLTLLNSAIGQGRVINLKQATQLKNDLEATIERLDSEIGKLAPMKSSVLSALQKYIESDIEYAEQLAKSPDYFDIRKASDIIHYVESLNDFTDLTKHPLFLYDELVDNGELSLSDDARELLDTWSSKTKLLKEEISQNKLNQINNYLDTNPIYQNIKKNVGEDILSNMDTNMRDITIVDQYFYGIGNNMIGKDHWIPVVTKQMYFQALAREEAKVKHLIGRLEKVQPDAFKELKNIGEILKKYGIEVNLHTFEILRELTEDGQKTQNLIKKLSRKWSDYIYDNTVRFSERRYNLWQQLNVNPQLIFDQIVQISKQRNQSLQENTEWFDPSRVPELAEFVKANDEYAEFIPYLGTDEESAQFKKDMISLMGEKQYKKSVEEQINKFQQFVAQTEVEFDTEMIAEKAQKKSGMTRGVWDRKYSPFVNPYTESITAATKTINMSELNYHVLIPKKSNNTGDTGFYNKIYEDVIEPNKNLSELRDIFEDMLSYVYNSLDQDARRKIQDPLFIPEQAKNLTDVLYEGVAFNEKMKNLAKWFWDTIRKYWSGNPSEIYSPLRINQTTGELSYTINQSFVKTNRAKFDAISKVERMKFAKLFGAVHKVEDGNQIHRPEAPLKRNQTVKASMLNNALLPLLNQYNGTPNWTIQNYINKYGEDIPVSTIIYKYAQHQVAMETSFDLPRILSMYAMTAAENAARHEVLPEAVMLKEKYESIKNSDNPEQITAEIRKRANARYGWWFEKHILNYSHKGESLWIKTRNKIKPKDINAEDAKIIKGEQIHKKTYDSFQTALVKDIDSYVKNNVEYLTDHDITELENVKQNMGDSVSVTAILDSILNFIRVKALGWNLSSSLTNVFAGQLSNSLVAISGRYFPYEYLFTITMNDMLSASTKSKINKSWVDPKMKLATVLFKMYDVKQDATNELQKATRKSIMNSGFMEKASPYYGITRGEDFNQMPLFIAYLRTKKILDQNGNEVSVWDAMEAYDVLDDKGKCVGWNARLKDEFRSTENVDNWEKMNGGEYSLFRTQVEQLIVTGHGDFSNYSGMMVKEDVFGRMIMMFKTWLPMEMHKRWASEQDDYIMGTKVKGRYRSHTATTLGAQLGLVGTFAAGPLGGLLGLAGGAVIGTFVGSRMAKASSQNTAGTGTIKKGRNLLDNLNESLILAQFLAKKIASFAVNPISKATTGKRPVNVERVYYDGQWRTLDDALGENGADFTPLDLQNWKSNAQEMAMTLTYMGLLLLVKAFTFDEDDEKDSTKRKIHHAAVNKIMQLAQETTMYLDPFNEQMGLKTAWSVGTFTFLGNVSKTIGSLADVFDGEGTYLSGPSAGQNKFTTNFNRTFVPGIFGSVSRQIIGDKEVGLIDLSGFTSLSERQFQNTPIDKWFTPKKNAEADVKAKRMELRETLREEGNLTDKQIEKQVNKEVPTIKQQEAKNNKGKKKRGRGTDEEEE